MRFEIEWQGNYYECEWINQTNFEELEPVEGSSGFLFDEDEKICLVHVPRKGRWTLVGGGKEEEDKTHEDTLRREAMEEADVELGEIKRLGYVRARKKGSEDSWKYTLKFIASITKKHPYTPDPAEGEMNEVIYVAPEKANEYLQWGENGDFQIQKALEKRKTSSKKDIRLQIEQAIAQKLQTQGRVSTKEIQDLTNQAIEENKEFIERRIRETSLTRGTILETAIHIENAMNQIILNYYGAQDQQNFYADILYDALGLKQKIDLINKICKREELYEKKVVEKTLKRKLKRFMEIRNIYAHLEENMFSEESLMRIKVSDYKSTKELQDEFFSFAQEISATLEKVSVYVVSRFMPRE